MEKRKRFELKRGALRTEDNEEVTDEDLQVSLTRGEKFDLKMLRVAEVIVGGLQEQINASSDNPGQLAASAANSRKRRRREGRTARDNMRKGRSKRKE